MRTPPKRVTSVTSVGVPPAPVTDSISDVTDMTDVTLLSPSDAQACMGSGHTGHGGRYGAFTKCMGKKPADPSYRSQTVTPAALHAARHRALRALRALVESPRPPIGPAPIRNVRVLPQVNELVVVMDYHTGRPRRPGVFRVYDQRGGVPRRVGKRWLPPAIVEYRVDGFHGWYKWFQLERVVE